MRLLLVLTLVCLPSYSQSTPPDLRAPGQPLFQSAQPQKPKNPCDPKTLRAPFAPFNFCSTEQNPATAPEIAISLGSPVPIAPLAPKLYAVCSVPLIGAHGVETHDSMVKPVPAAQGAFLAQVPAPPCEDWNK